MLWNEILKQTFFIVNLTAKFMLLLICWQKVAQILLSIHLFVDLRLHNGISNWHYSITWWSCTDTQVLKPARAQKYQSIFFFHWNINMKPFQSLFFQNKFRHLLKVEKRNKDRKWRKKKKDNNILEWSWHGQMEPQDNDAFLLRKKKKVNGLQQEYSDAFALNWRLILFESLLHRFAVIASTLYDQIDPSIVKPESINFYIEDSTEEGSLASFHLASVNNVIHKKKNLPLLLKMQ